MPTELRTTVGSGAWTVPANVSTVTAHCIGGGGGSAGTIQVGFGQGQLERGAAGGSYARRTFGVTPGQSISYFVGSGGTAGPVGNNSQGGRGGASWFMANGSSGCVAVGGQQSTTSARGVGTTAGCFGDVVYRGGNGGDLVAGQLAQYAGGGGGGAGTGGNGHDGGLGGEPPNTGQGGFERQNYGGAGGTARDGVSGVEGANPGLNYGGGASGPRCNAIFTSAAGAVGAQGIVVIEYTPNPPVDVNVGESITVDELASISVSATDAVAVGELANTELDGDGSDGFGVAELASIESQSDDAFPVDESASIHTSSDDIARLDEVASVVIEVSDSVGLDEVAFTLREVEASDSIPFEESTVITIASSDGAVAADDADAIAAVERSGVDAVTLAEDEILSSSAQAADSPEFGDTAELIVHESDTIGLDDSSILDRDETSPDPVGMVDEAWVSSIVEESALLAESAYVIIHAVETIEGGDLAGGQSDLTLSEPVEFSDAASIHLHVSDAVETPDGAAFSSVAEAEDTIALLEDAQVTVNVSDGIAVKDFAFNIGDGIRPDVAAIYEVRAERRRSEAPAECRTRDVSAEARTSRTVAESRTHHVPAEKRTKVVKR